MTQSKSSLKNQIDVASKRKKADIVIKNGKIVDVFSGEIIDGDIAICDGYISGIGSFEGRETIDAKGKFISPALIDGHVHIESSMLTPTEFSNVLIPHGVTTVITDPHEIANVFGEKGIQFMLNDAEHVPMDIFVMLPSSVPATAFEHNGATLQAKNLEPFFEHPNVLGLAEVMDYPAVLNAEDQMTDKLLLTKNYTTCIDGHAAGLDEHAINVYKAAGIRTDHECVNQDEAKARLSRGMHVLIREGSVAKDLKALIGLVNERNSRRFLFCTDDKHTDDLINEGSVDHNVRLAIQEGLDPITSIQLASINAAECYGLHQKGAIAPGYEANLLILDDLETFTIQSVFQKGEHIAENGKMINNSVRKINDDNVISHLKLPELVSSDFEIKLTDRLAHVIEIIPNSLVTKHLHIPVPTIDDRFFFSTDLDLLKIAVIERHQGTGNIGLGIVKGFKIKSGAIATTIAHDSHNLVMAGTNDEDMITAANRLKDIHGGLVVVQNGEVLAELSLPIAGLISDKSALDVNHKLQVIHEALQSIGASDEFNPFLTLSFLSLPVIPDLKLTDCGLFNVKTFQHINLSDN
ncbi:adenine deaminase [Terrilactibacillus laevilacticus]|uniref:Adenine deaminase n=1 Tax=Terrilactibacillus laevilacticus TaxID=1380157 RepID=A0ABW5PUX5_9BACI|nr:adenine deaminase [Terrilactibacillus laevilacticus]